MGKSSFPVLNKTGNSTVWDNMWDDLNYYNVKFEEDIFLKIFFELFFKERLFKHKFFLSKKLFVNLKNFYLSNFYINFKSYDTFKDTFSSFFKPEPVIFYFMKFHILRIEKTVIIILKLFFPVRKKKIIVKNVGLRKKILYKIYRFIRIISFFLELKKKTFSKKNF